MGKFEIREFIEEDWRAYKIIRLASLSDSPDSFGSTLEREAALSDDEWKSRLSFSGRAHSVLPLVAYMEGCAVGLAWGVVHSAESSVCHIYQMWVNPKCRGLGIGRAFLNKIAAWANQLKLNHLALSVTITNTSAVALYSSFGFYPVGDKESLRAGSELVSQSMQLSLAALNE